MRQLAAILVFAIGLASGNAVGEELASATSAVDQARVLIAAGKGREAQGFLTGAREQFPDDVQLLELKVQLLFDNERFGEAHKLIDTLQDGHDAVVSVQPDPQLEAAWKIVHAIP